MKAFPRKRVRPPGPDFLAALAVLVVGWALTLWVAPWSDDQISDLFVYRTFAEPVLSGALPYRELFFEYPPLAAPVIALPGVLGTGEGAFEAAFAGWTLLAAGAVVYLCGALAEATGGDRRRALLAAALMPLLCGALLRTRFDLFPVALLLGSLLLVVRERPTSGLAALGAGAMTKVFPLAAGPVLLAWLIGRGERRGAWRGALACLAVMAACGAAALAASPQGALDAVTYHLERPVQIESTPATVLLTLGDPVSVQSHRSDGLEHPAADLITLTFGVLLIGVILLLAARARGNPVLAALAAVVACIVLGKVLSPQFVIWVLPLGALAFAWRMHALAAAVALAALLTLVEFPAHYFDVVAREPLALALVGARNAVLLAVLGLALRELRPRRQEQLLDGRRAAVVVGVD